MNDFEFEFESLGQVQPQMQSQQADLGIGRVQEEFDRQNQGRDRVQDMVRRNQDAMMENLKTEAKNSGLKFEDMQKLASFSQTLTQEIVGYQKKKNEQKVQTGMMKAYADGYTPEEMAELYKDESELNAAQTEANRISREYELNGGQPDVAEELRNMTGWEAYGYAKGMLQKAGNNFGSWMAERSNMPVMTLNGKPLSLDTANNSVEREMVMRAHRETYISQYTGMNPKMLNEYLYSPMQKTEAAIVQQWDADYKQKMEKERDAHMLEELNAQIKSSPTPQPLLQFIDRNEALYGKYGAREKVANVLKGLIDTRQLSSDEVTQLLGTATGKNGNKIELGSWREFQGLEQRALDVEREQSDELYNDALRSDREVDMKFKKIIENDRDYLMELNPLQRYQFVQQVKKQLGRPDMEDTKQIKALINLPSTDEEQALAEIEALQEAGLPIPSSLLVTKELKDKYGQESADAAWAQQATKDNKGIIEAQLRGALMLTDGKIDVKSNEDYMRSLPYVTRYAEQKFKQVRAENPGESDAQVTRIVLDDIKKTLGDPGKFKESPLYYANVLLATPKESELNTLANVTKYSLEQQANGNKDFLSTQMIPGTGREYRQMEESIRAGKPEIPLIYHQLARTIPGISGIDIAREQLKVNGGPDFVLGKFDEDMAGLSPETKKILQGKEAYLTQHRVNRAVVSQEASKANPPAVQDLLDYVVQDESDGGRYDIIFGGGTVDNIENLTVRQVVDIQNQHLNKGYPSAAIGRYQMMYPDVAAGKVGLSLDAKFNKENQDKMAMYYLEMAGYSRFMSGQISAETFAHGLAGQWRALHVKGGGTYEQDGLNKAGSSTTYQGLLERVRRLTAESPYNAPENISPSLR
jgi:muramidase (phage lysozyme)